MNFAGRKKIPARLTEAAASDFFPFRTEKEFLNEIKARFPEPCQKIVSFSVAVKMHNFLSHEKSGAGHFFAFFAQRCKFENGIGIFVRLKFFWLLKSLSVFSAECLLP